MTGGRGRRMAKALIDRVVAVVLILALAPLLLLVALLVLGTSRGGALFKQQRLGRGGRPFAIYKFRTMYTGAERRFYELMTQQPGNVGGMFVKHQRDPRVTRIGRFLRRFSIDELPQLFNVVRGDMSLVGPRPLPVEVLQDGADVRRRLLMRPGMTGLWQVSGRSDLSYHDAVRIDLYYVENWSIAFDLVIMWKTLFATFRGDGAY